jgi:hypothetical protein
MYKEVILTHEYLNLLFDLWPWSEIFIFTTDTKIYRVTLRLRDTTPNYWKHMSNVMHGIKIRPRM